MSKGVNENNFIVLFYMAFIRSYNGAMQVLAEIGTGTCNGRCKTTWIRNFRYALKTKTNPLALTKKQRQNMTEKLKNVSGKNSINQHSKTLKKYRNRKSPPYPANENCNKQMVGNDGKYYISEPNVHNICSWKKI